MKRSRWLAMVAMVAMVLGACSSDDGGDVRDLGSDGSATGSASGSGSGSASGSASRSASGTAGAMCDPVNPDMEDDSDTTVEIELVDYAFAPSEIEVAVGVVTFRVTNSGTEPHELAFLPGGGEVPMTGDGAPDEEALAAAGAFELEAFGPGQTCNATFDLAPGEYTIFCVVETDDGTTHLVRGMEGTLTVTG
jgi:plastocyanin